MQTWDIAGLREMEMKGITHFPDVQNLSLIIRFSLMLWQGHFFFVEGLIPLQRIIYSKPRKIDLFIFLRTVLAWSKVQIA